MNRLARNILALLLGLACLASGRADGVEKIYVNSGPGNADGIRYVQNEDAHMVYTSLVNYGLISPNRLGKLKWKSISVNGNDAVVYDEACKPVVTTIEKLSSVQQAAITVAAAEILAVSNEDNKDKQSGRVRSLWFVNKPPETMAEPEKDLIQIDTRSNAISMHYAEEDNFSVFLKSLPDGLERVFLINKHVGFIYRDGRVDLKPECALTAAEQRLLELVLTTVRMAEKHLAFFSEQAGILADHIDGLSRDVQQLMQEMVDQRRLLERPRPDAQYQAEQLMAKNAELLRMAELRTAKFTMLSKMRSALQETLYNVDHNFQLSLRNSVTSPITTGRAIDQ